MDEPLIGTDDVGGVDERPGTEAAARPSIAPAETRQRMRDGTELLVRTWLPDPHRYPEPLGTLLLVHGLAEHSSAATCG